MISQVRTLIAKASALLLVFCLTCLSVLAVTPVEVKIETALPQSGGQVVTTNNQPIIVNGNSTPPGTTILSGSTLETPPGVGATLQLGFADLEIAPGSEVLVEFTSDGNVKVTLKRGCAVLKKKDNQQGVIITPDGTTTEINKDKKAAVCFPVGATSPIVTAGAGIGEGISSALLTAFVIAGGGGLLAGILLASDDTPASGISP